MPSRFRKSGREFSEQIIKNAVQQKANGPLGNQLQRDFIVDECGNQQSTKYQFTGLRIGQDGIPLVYTESVGVVLDGCGHRVFGQDEILGRCRYGHVVCTKCQLYTCTMCGEKICPRDMVELEDGSVICHEHQTTVLLQGIRTGFGRMIGDTIRGLFGLSSVEHDEASVH